MWTSVRSSLLIAVAVIVALVSYADVTVLEVSAGQAASADNRNELIAVTSKDGTRIGVECAGTGPTLLFVHGGVGDRSRWTPMFPLLASKFTACAMDGSGA